MQSSLYQATRRQSPTIVISIDIAFSISNSFFLFVPFPSFPCFSCLFISVFCFVISLLPLFISFLLTSFFSSYHVQFVKFCLSTSLIFFHVSLFYLSKFPPYFHPSLLPLFIISFLINYLFPVTFITPNFFPSLFSFLLHFFHSLSLLSLSFPLSLHFPLAIHAQYSDRCYTRL